jgi:hypothetical protein
MKCRLPCSIHNNASLLSSPTVVRYCGATRARAHPYILILPALLSCQISLLDQTASAHLVRRIHVCLGRQKHLEHLPLAVKGGFHQARHPVLPTGGVKHDAGPSFSRLHESLSATDRRCQAARAAHAHSGTTTIKAPLECQLPTPFQVSAFLSRTGAT